MAIQFITNDKGEKTAVIIKMAEYEDLLHQHHLNLELTDGYKKLMDVMLEEEENVKAAYATFTIVKDRFPTK